MPASPADLMLRRVNHRVDGHLGPRRRLTAQLTHLRQHLLDPKSGFDDWPMLRDSRNALHWLEDTCEDQRSARQEWIDVPNERPLQTAAQARRERERLRVRSRDVREHVARVVGHVRRLKRRAETAVPMHFPALGHRTHAIMRTLTVLTAVFLPLDLITGFFGTDFDSLPLIHSATGVRVAVGTMVVVGVGLTAFFMRKRYLGTQGR
jgi:magnesium transporter